MKKILNILLNCASLTMSLLSYMIPINRYAWTNDPRLVDTSGVIVIVLFCSIAMILSTGAYITTYKKHAQLRTILKNRYVVLSLFSFLLALARFLQASSHYSG